MIKKIIIGFSVLLLFSSIILGVHIYMVTRPKPLDPKTLVLARIDYSSAISKKDSQQIINFLYANEGVSHVYIPDHGKNVIFSFYPAKEDGNKIIDQLNASLGMDGKRYLPSKEEMMAGCPINQDSFSMRAYKYFTSIF